MVRILQRIGVEGALRHSLVGFGQHQEAAFHGGVLDEFSKPSGIVKICQRARHHGGLVSSVAQGDAFDNQSCFGGFVVDVKTAYAAFQFDVHRGDVAQNLGGAASGHYQRGGEGGACGIQFGSEVAFENGGFCTFGFDGAGGGIGLYRYQSINRISTILVQRRAVCHAIQFQVGDAFQFRREDGRLAGGSGTAQFEGFRRGVVIRGGFPCFQVLVISAVCGGGKHIDVQIINLVFTLGGDGTGIFLRLSSATKYETNLFALCSGDRSLLHTQLCLAAS